MNTRRFMLLFFCLLSLGLNMSLSAAERPMVGGMLLGNYYHREEGRIALDFLHLIETAPAKGQSREGQLKESELVSEPHLVLVREAVQGYAPGEPLKYFLGAMRDGVIAFVAYTESNRLMLKGELILVDNQVSFVRIQELAETGKE